MVLGIPRCLPPLPRRWRPSQDTVAAIPRHYPPGTISGRWSLGTALSPSRDGGCHLGTPSRSPGKSPSRHHLGRVETPATKTQNLSEPPCVIVSGRAHEHLPGWFFTLSGDTLPRALSRWKKPYGTSSRDAQTPLPRGGLPRYRIPSRDGTNVCVMVARGLAAVTGLY